MLASFEIKSLYCNLFFLWSLVFNSHRPHITVAQRVIQSYSLLQHRVTWFYRQDYCTPEERKPRVTTLPHTHIKHNSVIKLSQIPRSSAGRDSLLWAVQGCQDHHNDSKLLLLYSPLLQPHPQKMFLSFSSFQVWRVESLMEIPVCPYACQPPSVPFKNP